MLYMIVLEPYPTGIEMKRPPQLTLAEQIDMSHQLGAKVDARIKYERLQQKKSQADIPELPALSEAEQRQLDDTRRSITAKYRALEQQRKAGLTLNEAADLELCTKEWVTMQQRYVALAKDQREFMKYEAIMQDNRGMVARDGLDQLRSTPLTVTEISEMDSCFDAITPKEITGDMQFPDIIRSARDALANIDKFRKSRAEIPKPSRSAEPMLPPLPRDLLRKRIQPKR
jgi:hypothetical protein